jgi:hypothetical protein
MWEEARYEARNPQNSESSNYGYKFTIDTSQNSHLINKRYVPSLVMLRVFKSLYFILLILF